MDIDETIRQTVGDIIAARSGSFPQDLIIDRQRLGGGAEATEVALVTARYRTPRNRPTMLRVVVKQLDGRAAREALVYQRLVAAHAVQIAPELLAVESLGPDSALIFLEAIRRIRAWPWQDQAASADVMHRLGSFHAATRNAAQALPAWNYEAELADMAETTWTVLDQCRRDPEYAALGRHIRALERVILALPALRRQLLCEQPFGCRPIHGDVHPGNALLRQRNGGFQAILIDWGRARPGSPLEDVSSWLQSLCFWDAEAQRIHDRLFATYLSAFGMERSLTPDIRAAYWTAGASNALAGALLYHLSIVTDRQQGKAARARAFQAARNWMRIIRRAHDWSGIRQM